MCSCSLPSEGHNSRSFVSKDPLISNNLFYCLCLDSFINLDLLFCNLLYYQIINKFWKKVNVNFHGNRNVIIICIRHFHWIIENDHIDVVTRICNIDRAFLLFLFSITDSKSQTTILLENIDIHIPYLYIFLLQASSWINARYTGSPWTRFDCSLCCWHRRATFYILSVSQLAILKFYLFTIQ